MTHSGFAENFIEIIPFYKKGKLRPGAEGMDRVDGRNGVEEEVPKLGGLGLR